MLDDNRVAKPRRILAHLILAAFFATLVSCVAMPRLAAPQVDVNTVRVDRFSGGEAQFTIVLNLTNPNEREVAVEAIDAELRIENVAVGTAHLVEPVRLAARGATSASITVRAGLASTLRAAAEVARRAEAEGGTLAVVRYTVSGVAVIDGGLTLPFSRSAEFAWPRARAQ